MSQFSRSLQPGAPFFSQAGEDLRAARLFRKIGVRSRTAVEFGATDGRYKSNTAYFRESLGWTVWMFDGDPRLVKGSDAIHGVHHEWITAENVNEVFRRYGVPDDLDLLSIDIDGNDLWVWKALTYRPSVVIIEYNPRWRAKRRRTVVYDPARGAWDHTEYFGASAGALVALGREKGYVLAAATHFNLIFAPEGAVPELHLSHVTHRKSERPDPQERPWVAYP